MKWLPLSKRDDPEQAKTYDALHEGVPEWLAGPVGRWIFETFKSMYDYDLRNNLDLLYGMLRRPMPLHNTDGLIEDLANGAAGGDLNILDAIVWLTGTYAGGWTQRDRLDLLLLVHGSAWTVGTSETNQPCLERRVDETTTAAAKAEMEQVGNAAIHLRRAWHRVYGKNPDAGGAPDAERFGAPLALLADLIFGADYPRALMELRFQAFLDELGPNPLSDAQARVVQAVDARKAQLVRHALGDLQQWQTHLRALANHLEDLEARSARESDS